MHSREIDLLPMDGLARGARAPGGRGGVRAVRARAMARRARARRDGRLSLCGREPLSSIWDRHDCWISRPARSVE